jgi:hypothetical protein
VSPGVSFDKNFQVVFSSISLTQVVFYIKNSINDADVIGVLNAQEYDETIFGALDAWKNPFSSIFGTPSGADAWLASDTTAFAETYIESPETAEAYVFSARLPAGVTKEEVRVDMEEKGHDRVLVIAGERSVRTVRTEQAAGSDVC